MSYHLFLDDSRWPQDVTWVDLPKVDWTIARNHRSFVQLLELHGMPSFITYDCDLCDEHYEAYFTLRERYLLHYKKFKTKCGIECVEHVLAICNKHNWPHPPYIAHTQNKYAKGYIENIITKHNKEIAQRLGQSGHSPILRPS